MIQANELRIGNLVFRDELNIENGKWDELTIKINYQDIFNLINGNDMVKTAYNPIRLTEEWLVRFGAISNSYQDRYEFDVIHIECNKTRGITELWIERMPHIKYVHQLQNLYFALTGEELTIKN